MQLLAGAAARTKPFRMLILTLLAEAGVEGLTAEEMLAALERLRQAAES